MARVYALDGRQREARQMIKGLKANPYIIAAVYVALGDQDEAFRILEKAIGENQFLTPLKVEPPLESLHSDPRWKTLLRRMNFPPNDPASRGPTATKVRGHKKGQDHL
jgi:hypothetical protein